MLKRLIKAARHGDDVAARALVEYLAECLERGEPPPVVLAEYFAPALRRIADGRSADDALGLGKHSRFGQHYEIARQVWMLNHRAVDQLPLRDNSKKKGAYSVVGAEYNLSAYRIEQIYRELKDLVAAEFLDDTPSTDAEAQRHAAAQQAIAFSKLAEALRKQGRK